MKILKLILAFLLTASVNLLAESLSNEDLDKIFIGYKLQEKLEQQKNFESNRVKEIERKKKEQKLSNANVMGAINPNNRRIYYPRDGSAIVKEKGFVNGKGFALPPTQVKQRIPLSSGQIQAVLCDKKNCKIVKDDKTFKVGDKISSREIIKKITAKYMITNKQKIIF